LRRLYETIIPSRQSHKYLWDVLPDRSWAGKACFIIGGGPSLREFPFSRLKGKRTIGINLAFQKFDPTITFSMDSRFLKWMETEQYGRETTRKFERLQGYRVMLMTYPAAFPPLVYIVPVHKNYTEAHWALTEKMRQGLGHGNNSGYAALNLAACLGANPIYLLGYDMKHDGDRTHWHRGHPKVQSKDQIATFPQYFNWAAPQLLKKKIRVINLNYESGLTCFPKQNWSEVL